MSLDGRAIVDLAKALSRDDFVAQAPQWFLILGEEKGGDNPESTAVGEFKDGPTRRRYSGPGANILPITPREESSLSGADRIWIGRSPRCDLVLRDWSVSKQHAVFRVRGERLAVLDENSQNGTLLNGEPLIPEQAKTLSVNDIIQFGTVITRFVDAAALYELIAQGSSSLR
jgi:pSer/pThr/pTyr-binding forkhead associated (FHA) protein